MAYPSEDGVRPNLQPGNRRRRNCRMKGTRALTLIGCAPCLPDGKNILPLPHNKLQPAPGKALPRTAVKGRLRRAAAAACMIEMQMTISSTALAQDRTLGLMGRHWREARVSGRPHKLRRPARVRSRYPPGYYHHSRAHGRVEVCPGNMLEPAHRFGFQNDCRDCHWQFQHPCRNR